jgi:hypothetical protein
VRFVGNVLEGKSELKGSQTVIDLEHVFEQYTDEFKNFASVLNPLHVRPDICGFLVLDSLVPGTTEVMVGGADHDQIWLSVDCKRLAAIATEEDILLLVRCGVCYDEREESLYMFV